VTNQNVTALKRNLTCVRWKIRTQPDRRT